MVEDRQQIVRCFVIMPYTVRAGDLSKYGEDSDHWSQVFEGLIRPAAKEAGVDANRESDFNKSKIITLEIWRNIEEADIVICDISGENSNVMLELGWALRSDKPLVLIKDDLTVSMFDLKTMHIMQYNHLLKPLRLKEEVKILADLIRSTFVDAKRSFSLVRQLGIAAGSDPQSTAESTIEKAVLKAIAAAAPLHGGAKAGPRVIIFWRSQHFPQVQAEAIASELRALGISSAMRQHGRRDLPDAIFVAAGADPNIVGNVLRKIPYVPSYIFPTNHPDNECGASTGADISIGLNARHREHVMIEAERPYPLAPLDFSALCDPRLTSQKLKAILDRVAPPRKSDA